MCAVTTLVCFIPSSFDFTLRLWVEQLRRADRPAVNTEPDRLEATVPYSRYWGSAPWLRVGIGDSKPVSSSVCLYLPQILENLSLWPSLNHTDVFEEQTW